MFAQLAAAVIFLVMFVMIITEKIERHIVTLTCALLTLIVVFGIGMRSMDAIHEALSLYSLVRLDFWYQVGAPTTSTGVNWETICFLAGMMVMVEGMADSGFFRWLCITLAWALSMGTDIGGSATPIGASANVVGVSIAAKNGHPIGWGRYCRFMAPATVLVMVISNLILFLRFL